MGLWARLFGKEREERPQTQLSGPVEEDVLEPKVRYEEIPGTLDLGWYYSENKDEYQMAKVAEKDRATHLYVIGATGTGKTKFLEFLIQQDVEKGNGFGVIDPHGDLIEDVKGFLACYYDQHRDEETLDRVVLLDPTDPHFTVTFNPLEKLPNVSVAEQAGELVSAFRKIWSDSWGVRMEDLMRNSLIALGEAGLTLAELPHFLTEREFREGVLQRVEHPIARQYFQRFDALTDRGQLPVIEPVMNKTNAFLSDQRIRQMFSSPKSSFNPREVIHHKKILLIKLDKGKLKDSADLLGSLLLAKLQLAAFSRSDLPQNKRTPFYLYIDEFQNFASESFMVVLSEARKYGLSLIMAHQTLAQIPEELRSLILGNTGIQVYFRVNRRDAQLLAKEAFQYSGYEVKTVRHLHPVFWTLGEEWEHKTEELQNLPPRCCYAKHKIEGGLIPLFTAEIEPAWEILGIEQDEYREYLKSLPFGKKYLVARGELTERELRVMPEKVRTKEELQIAEDGHRHLQSLIKQIAEGKGYQAITEAPTPDGLGRVDVSLERDGRRIACEVSITSTDEQELSNIEKCLRAGYDRVILCSPEEKTLYRVKELVSRKLSKSECEKVLFSKPEEVSPYLERLAVRTAKKRVKAELEEEIPLSVKSAELWQEKIWYAMRHLDDPSILNKSSLSRLIYIEKLAEEEFQNYSLRRGLALKRALSSCIDKIVSDAKDQVGLQKICQFLELVKEGQNLTDISKALGLSRERVSTSYKKKAVKLVTQEFMDLVKTRRNK
jgi:hypothetical protein